MFNYYELAGVVLALEVRDDGLFRRLHGELHTYQTSAPVTADAMVTLSGQDGLAAPPPPRAVRAAYRVGSGELGYAHDNVDIVLREDVFRIEFDYPGRRLHVAYRNEKAVGALARHALKWLFIKLAQERGLAYIHGSAARFAGRNVVFVGFQGAGKSSCLFRLRQVGARVISDDCVLLREHVLVPFTLKTNIKGDFAERFGLGEQWNYDLAPELYRNGEVGGVDLFVFPRVWHHPGSEVQPLLPEAALEALFESYVTEHVYRARPVSDDHVRATYRALVEHTPCFRFDAGTDEQEVRSRLLTFLSDPP